MAVSRGRLINTASGVVGGYAPLDSGLLVPTAYLPPAVFGCASSEVQGTGSADYTTGSATFASVDGTNLTITTTNAQSGDKLLIEAMLATDGGNTGNAALTFSIAGTDVGDTLGLEFVGSGEKFRGTIFYQHTMVSGTQVAILLRWKTASGTLAMYNRTAVVRPRLRVMNLSRGGTL